MAPKHTLEHNLSNADSSLSIDDLAPPAKRRMMSIPQTPLPRRSTVSSLTPFTGTPFPLRPSDSPSNPFGRKRKQVLSHSLPPPTSFSKHLPLRFQFVRPGASPRLGGIFRVVQVPLSYTFAQLRCLIAWLFGGGYVDEREDRHLFELKKKIVMYSMTYKPCQIRSGFTAVKLSTARDPCRYRPEEDDALDEETETHDEHSEDGDEDNDEGWTWEAEEEYTLGNAWSRGGDLGRGIIYHHTPDTAVHITVNVGPLPRRKGTSNTPYVFHGRGRVRLLPPSPLLLPRPVFSVPTHKLPVPSSPPIARSSSSPSRQPASRNSAETTYENDDVEYEDASSSGFFFDNDDDEQSCSSEDEDEQDLPEDPNAPVDPAKYNAPHAFASYLRIAHQHRRRCEFSFDSNSSDSESELDTPGLIHCHSSSSPLKPSSSSPVKTSSSSSPLRSSPYTIYDPQAALSRSLSSAAYTPAPPHASWQRLRLERVRKRMEKAKRVWVDTEDEAEAEGAEVDELGLDGAPGKEGEMKLWVKPVLKPGEVWDPFGDELEV